MELGLDLEVDPRDGNGFARETLDNPYTIPPLPSLLTSLLQLSNTPALVLHAPTPTSPVAARAKLYAVDYVVIASYFVVVFVICVVASWRRRGSTMANEELEQGDDTTAANTTSTEDDIHDDEEKGVDGMVEQDGEGEQDSVEDQGDEGETQSKKETRAPLFQQTIGSNLPNQLQRKKHRLHLTSASASASSSSTSEQTYVHAPMSTSTAINADAPSASDAYFLASRNTTFLGIGASLFMSNIGSEHFVGLASSGMATGLAVSYFEWLAVLFISLVLSYIMVPVLLRLGVRTIPEVLTRRFGGKCGAYVGVVNIVAGVLVKICVVLYSGSVILKVLLGWNAALSLCVLLGITGMYTIIGGLQAVIWTEIMQSAMLFAGGIPLVIFGLKAVGGWGGLVNYYHENGIAYQLHIFNRGANTGGDGQYPWIGLLFGLPFMQFWYWCTDQVVVQRVLAGKSLLHAQGGCNLCGFLKLFIPVIMVIPGLCARILFSDSLQNPNDAYALLVGSLLPRGLTGLMVAAMLAALMSGLASTFNSISTVIVYDFYQPFRPSSSGSHLILVGRISIVVLTIIGIAWIPVISHVSNQLYIYIQSTISYIAPSVSIVYLGAISSKTKFITPSAALSTLVFGGLLGMVRLVCEVIYKSVGSPTIGFKPWSWFVYANFLYFCIFEAVVCSFVIVGVSVFTQGSVDQQKVENFFSRGKESMNQAQSDEFVPRSYPADYDPDDEIQTRDEQEQAHKVALGSDDKAAPPLFFLRSPLNRPSRLRLSITKRMVYSMLIDVCSACISAMAVSVIAHFA